MQYGIVMLSLMMLAEPIEGLNRAGHLPVEA